MAPVTGFCSVPRWILIGLFVITWIHLTTGACHHYGHSCLGAHGKKRSGGITVDSAPLPYSRPLLSLPLDTLSSDEIGDLAVQVVESKGQRQTVAKTNERPLPSRFLHTILMTRMKDN